MTPAVPRFLSAASSDPGFVRGNNEDRVYCDDVRGFFMVIDGMGGHAAGEQAADIALERIKSRLERQTDSAEQRIREAIALANNAIYEAAQSKDEWNGMACVLTVALIENGQAIIGHVGDSRLYKIRPRKIEKITHDHSPVGEREDSGELSEAEAMRHPRRNEVFRDVGSQQHAPDDQDFIEIIKIPFESDSALLLCSDGLSDVLPSAKILRIVEQNAGDRWAAVRRLIEAAIEDGKDNISVVLVEGERFTVPVKKAAPLPNPIRVRIPWYWRAAYLVSGIVLGGLLVLAVERFLPRPEPPHIPERIVVGQPATIASALVSAKAGDTIVVQPGLYRETVQLRDGVDVIAQRAHESVIEGGFIADAVQRARIEGFTIKANAVGISAHDSNIAIARCEITGARTAGVRFTGASHGSLTASSIHDNSGVGILIDGTSAPAIENDIVVSNLKPGLVVRSTGRPVIAGNIFLTSGTEAIWLTSADDAIAQRNYFSVSAKTDKRKPVRLIQAAEAQP